MNTLTKEQLLEALSKLPDGVELATNKLGNLIVIKETHYIAYINFADGTVTTQEDIDSKEDKNDPTDSL